MHRSKGSSLRPQEVGPATGSEPTGHCSRGSQQRLASLLESASLLNSTLSLSRVLDAILAQATSLVRCESGSVLLCSSQSAQLEVAAAVGPRADEISRHWQQDGHPVAEWVLRHGEPVHLSRCRPHPALHQFCRREDIREALCVPLLREGRGVGVLTVSNTLSGSDFEPDDLACLAVLANHAACAVRNARNYETIGRQRAELERMLNDASVAQASERRRISVMLHDGPAQDAFAVVQSTGAVLDQLEQSNAGPELIEAARRSVHVARHSLESIRNVMTEARGGALAPGELRGVLHDVARQIETRSSIHPTVSVRLDAALPVWAVTVIGQIAQEALTNSWKHSGARNLNVTVVEEAGAIELRVTDDGRGFPEPGDPLQTQRGIGIATMHDRARTLGAELKIRASPSGGTEVIVRLSRASLQGELL